MVAVLGEPPGMDQISEALAGMTQVFYQQMEANVPRRQLVHPFSLLEKFSKVNFPKFREDLDPPE